MVAFDWLVAQLAQGADAVCGTITVQGWSFLPSFDQCSFERNEVNPMINDTYTERILV